MPADLFSSPEDEIMAPDSEQPAAPRPDAVKSKPALAPEKAAPVPAQPAPSFEEAFGRLETLVAELERGELPLEQLLDRFEEGVQLVRHCQAFLKQAQLRVEQYVEQRDGRWVLKELDAD